MKIMSVWRRKALDLFPQFREEFVQPDATPYTVFFELLPLVQEYHATNNIEGLNKIYDYVDWCYGQWHRSYYLGNAAAVAFYEHLVDHRMTLEAIPKWIKPQTARDVLSLWEWKVGNRQENLKKMLKEYDRLHGTALFKKK